MTQSQVPDDDTRIVEVYAAANEIDAGAVRAALEEAGIRAELVGVTVGNAFDIPIGFTGPRIWVREADGVSARSIIEAMQDRLGGDSSDAGAFDASAIDPESLDVAEPDRDGFAD